MPKPTVICARELQTDWIDSAPTVLVLANGEWVHPGCADPECGYLWRPTSSAPTSEAAESALLDEESPVYTAVNPRSTDA